VERTAIIRARRRTAGQHAITRPSYGGHNHADDRFIAFVEDRSIDRGALPERNHSIGDDATGGKCQILERTVGAALAGRNPDGSKPFPPVEAAID
jgi:hypothetical protein